MKKYNLLFIIWKSAKAGLYFVITLVALLVIMGSFSSKLTDKVHTLSIENQLSEHLEVTLIRQNASKQFKIEDQFIANYPALPAIKHANLKVAPQETQNIYYDGSLNQKRLLIINTADEQKIIELLLEKQQDEASKGKKIIIQDLKELKTITIDMASETSNSYAAALWCNIIIAGLLNICIIFKIIKELVASFSKE